MGKLSRDCVLISRDAIIEYHRLGGLNNRNLLFSQFWRLGANNKVLVGLVSSDASLLTLQMAAFLLCPHMLTLGSIYYCFFLNFFF